MKQDLPWSVSGIPPEARDIARAAAGRDGLSVGDWITRRILTETARTLSASDRGTPVNQLSYKNERDDETRRDRDDLVQRLARTEAETDGAFRRIDETLRAMGRRMETTERSQNEAQRTMSAAAAEISTATREQSQAFDHLNQRIERVERQSDNSALRDAVRGLHQGLSRLADQIAKTANESTNQVGTIAANVEALAGKISQVRDEANLGAQVIDGRINALAERIRVTEERLVASEPRADEIEHVAHIVKSLEKTVDGIAERLAASEKLSTTVARVETRVDSAEDRMQDAMGRHLAAIERNLAAIGERLEQSEAKRSDAEEAIKDSMRALGTRIDTGETHTLEAFADLKTQLGDATKRIDSIEAGANLMAPYAAAPAYAAAPPPAAPHMAPPPPQAAAPGGFDLPPFADAPPFPSGSYASHPADEYVPPPSLASGDVFAPPAESTIPPVAQDYLAAARRAAQASTASDATRGARAPLGAFHTDTAGASSRRRRKLPLIVGVVGLVLLAAVAGILITRNLGGSPAPIQAPLKSGVDGTTPAPSDGMPDLTGPASAPATPTHARSTNPAQPEDEVARDNAPVEPLNRQPARPLPSTGQQVATTGPVAAPTAAAHAAPTPLDRLLASAKSGDAKAQLLLGLRYLEGDGVAASDSEAVRWLRKAAEQGEPVAMYRLGTMYERGRSLSVDPAQAKYWYLQAANHGNRKAMHNLAVAFAEGSGAEKNYTEAARWFKAASELGLTDSEFNLAVLYERGLGVAQSLTEAYKWYSIAAAQGDTESRARIEVLNTQLSANDRTAAERAAKAFRPKPMDRDANEAPELAQVAP